MVRVLSHAVKMLLTERVWPKNSYDAKNHSRLQVDECIKRIISVANVNYFQSTVRVMMLTVHACVPVNVSTCVCRMLRRLSSVNVLLCNERRQKYLLIYLKTTGRLPR